VADVKDIVKKMDSELAELREESSHCALMHDECEVCGSAPCDCVESYSPYDEDC
jgi:hypothetical protein